MDLPRNRVGHPQRCHLVRQACCTARSCHSDGAAQSFSDRTAKSSASAARSAWMADHLPRCRATGRTWTTTHPWSSSKHIFDDRLLGAQTPRQAVCTHAVPLYLAPGL